MYILAIILGVLLITWMVFGGDLFGHDDGDAHCHGHDGHGGDGDGDVDGDVDGDNGIGTAMAQALVSVFSVRSVGFFMFTFGLIGQFGGIKGILGFSNEDTTFVVAGLIGITTAWIASKAWARLVKSLTVTGAEPLTAVVGREAEVTVPISSTTGKVLVPHAGGLIEVEAKLTVGDNRNVASGAKVSVISVEGDVLIVM